MPAAGWSMVITERMERCEKEVLRLRRQLHLARRRLIYRRREHQEFEATVDIFWRLFVAPLWDRLDQLQLQLSSFSPNTHNLEELTIRTIRYALCTTGNNRMAASRLLGVNIKTLYNWLRKIERRSREVTPGLPGPREVLSGDFFSTKKPPANWPASRLGEP